MLSKKLAELINKQIEREYHSSYLYTSMSAYCNSKNLDGFAHWFYVQAKEELDHAQMFVDYMVRMNAPLEFLAIEAPASSFDSLEKVLKQTYAHEQVVTSLIFGLLEQAQEDKDYRTVQFLQWYVAEQMEEEENTLALVEKHNMAKVSDAGVLFLDKEVLARVYSQPVQLAKK